ncbi:M28 family peptidase [Actinoplanes sp. NPDC051411]|uniref:M28 family peptidase n=1 Tax=Actinoplanes sp. NPDC051411 TaxID=3155522 RepID=UPI00342B9553
MRAPALVDVARRALAALAAIVVLALVGLAAVRSVEPPAAAGASTPPSQFSAGRAFAQVQAIATVPHPVGSAAQDRVRDHLVTTLQGLGLAPEVQDTVSPEGSELSSSAGGIGIAHVRNVITVIPGTASTGRLFLVAHYDSVQTGPGGNDDAAGVATVLETARALVSGPKLRNDVVLVLTDAEEACLCGAAAFVHQSPLAEDGGVVLNFEARGSSGPAIMFETSDHNQKLVDAYAHTPKPVGTSFAVEIYRLLPNDTDFTPFRLAGFQGLNSAYIDGAAVYHAPTDRPSAMDRDSLQHHGDNALALTRELGDDNLTQLGSNEDATYFPAPGLLVRYPGALVWPLAALALAAVLVLAWLARRRGLITAKRGAGAFAVTLIPIVAAPVLAQLYWLVLKLIRPAYAELPIDPYHPQPYRVGVLALTALVIFAWFALFRRRLGAAALAIAGLGWLAALGLVLAGLTPGGSYLAALPALAGAILGIVAVLLRGWWSVAAVVVGGAVAVIILLPTVIMLFPALGMPMAGAGAFLAVLLGLALLPVVDLIHPEGGGQRGLEALSARRRALFPTLTAALALIVASVIGLSVDRFDDTHPALTQLMYALDADTGTAQWISDEPSVQKWTSRYVSGDPHEVRDSLPVFGPEKVRTGQAQPADLPAPKLTVEKDVPSTGARRLVLRLTPQRPVRLVTLHVGADTRVLAAEVQGQSIIPANRKDQKWGWGFTFHGPPADGIEITVTVRTPGPVAFRVMDGSDGFDGVPGFQARPAGVGIVGSHTSELLAVAKTYNF